jgi:hypothetical protein
MYERLIEWYYQGSEPAIYDHSERLTLETVSGWADRYLSEAEQICERFARAHTPEQMIEYLLDEHTKVSK